MPAQNAHCYLLTPPPPVSLQHGANVDCVDGQNRTPLHWAGESYPGGLQSGLEDQSSFQTVSPVSMEQQITETDDIESADTLTNIIDIILLLIFVNVNLTNITY